MSLHSISVITVMSLIISEQLFDDCCQHRDASHHHHHPKYLSYLLLYNTESAVICTSSTVVIIINIIIIIIIILVIIITNTAFYGIKNAKPVVTCYTVVVVIISIISTHWISGSWWSTVAGAVSVISRLWRIQPELCNCSINRSKWGVIVMLYQFYASGSQLLEQYIYSMKFSAGVLNRFPCCLYLACPSILAERVSTLDWISLCCAPIIVACSESRLVPLSKVLYDTCFFCGQRCKCWSHRPKLTLSVISDVKPNIYILLM